MRHGIPIRRSIVESLESRTLPCGGATVSAAPDPAQPAPFGPIGPEVNVGNGRDPSVASDAAGSYVVAWFGEDDNGPGVFARRFTAAGAPVVEQFRVSDDVEGNAAPAVAMDADGDFVIVWTGVQADDLGPGVYARRFDSVGAALGDAVRVNTDTTGSEFTPAVAMAGGGEFVIAWSGYRDDGIGLDVYARSFNADGAARDNEFRVNAATSDNQMSPSVAFGAGGGFIIAWDGRPSGPPQTSVGSMTPSSSYVYSAPAPETDDSGAGVYARRFTAPGQPAGDEFLVNTSTAGDQSDPSVAANSRGDFVIAWRSSFTLDAQTEGGVYARRYGAAGEPAGLELRVTTGSEFLESVAIDGDGDFLVAYGRIGVGHVATCWGLCCLCPQSGPLRYVQRYSANGQPLGDPVIISGESVSMATQPDGDIVAVYSAGGLAGDTLHAQRFGQLPPRVTAVFVGSTAWTPEFRDALDQAQGLGDATFGYAISGSSQQLDVLPWNNVDTISLRFSQDLSLSQARLSVASLTGGDYPATAFAYEHETYTATWRLAQPIARDRVLVRLKSAADVGLNPAVPPWWWLAAPGAEVELDGDWSNGSSDFPSGDGLPGGDFLFSINVLPGDVDRSGAVLANDFSAVKQRFFATPAGAGYSIFHDIDGSGGILAGDFSAVKAHFFGSLPVPGSEYGGPGVPPWAWGSVTAAGLPSWLYGG